MKKKINFANLPTLSSFHDDRCRNDIFNSVHFLECGMLETVKKIQIPVFFRQPTMQNEFPEVRAIRNGGLLPMNMKYVSANQSLHENKLFNVDCIWADDKYKNADSIQQMSIRFVSWIMHSIHFINQSNRVIGLRTVVNHQISPKFFYFALTNCPRWLIDPKIIQSLRCYFLAHNNTHGQAHQDPKIVESCNLCNFLKSPFFVSMNTELELLDRPTVQQTLRAEWLNMKFPKFEHQQQRLEPKEFTSHGILGKTSAPPSYHQVGVESLKRGGGGEVMTIHNSVIGSVGAGPSKRPKPSPFGGPPPPSHHQRHHHQSQMSTVVGMEEEQGYLNYSQGYYEKVVGTLIRDYISSKVGTNKMITFNKSKVKIEEPRLFGGAAGSVLKLTYYATIDGVDPTPQYVKISFSVRVSADIFCIQENQQFDKSFMAKAINPLVVETFVYRIMDKILNIDPDPLDPCGPRLDIAIRSFQVASVRIDEFFKDESQPLVDGQSTTIVAFDRERMALKPIPNPAATQQTSDIVQTLLSSSRKPAPISSSMHPPSSKTQKQQDYDFCIPSKLQTQIGLSLADNWMCREELQNASVVISEWVNKGDLQNWIDATLKSLFGMTFNHVDELMDTFTNHFFKPLDVMIKQILCALIRVQEFHPFFRHNDLHIKNVLVRSAPPTPLSTNVTNDSMFATQRTDFCGEFTQDIVIENHDYLDEVPEAMRIENFTVKLGDGQYHALLYDFDRVSGFAGYIEKDVEKGWYISTLTQGPRNIKTDMAVVEQARKEFAGNLNFRHLSKELNLANGGNQEQCIARIERAARIKRIAEFMGLNRANVFDQVMHHACYDAYVFMHSISTYVGITLSKQQPNAQINLYFQDMMKAYVQFGEFRIWTSQPGRNDLSYHLNPEYDLRMINETMAFAHHPECQNLKTFLWAFIKNIENDANRK